MADAKSGKESVQVKLSNGESMISKLLVGADGINSNVRNIIMREHGLPEIRPHHCGYAYFRAVIDVSSDTCPVDSERWHRFSFESWGEQIRFGYVPLH